MISQEFADGSIMICRTGILIKAMRQSGYAYHPEIGPNIFTERLIGYNLALLAKKRQNLKWPPNNGKAVLICNQIRISLK